ncbi:hypothetical protein WJX84_008579 [Apatococcus fuscideae]|uniref:MAU2 chromatid cohesion factor homolog n=1 Tax=Apatococcus fuscideae TaxID=2026836 RepID=A0AAW1T3U0_9CHLO
MSLTSTAPAPSAGVDALLLLAKGFVARGQPLLAIKCYVAVCQSKHEFPAVEAHAQIQLGTLLLEHSHNVLEAHQALSKAQLLLERSTGNFDLKCKALSGLGRCQKYLRKIRHQQQTYKRAITLCSAALHTPDRASAQHWLLHFHLRAANVEMDSAASVGSAVEALEASMKLAADANLPSAQALCQLFKAQLLMTDDSRQAAAAQEALDACHAALAAQPCGPSTGLPLAIYAQLRLHHALLRCLLLLSQGSIATLAACPSGGKQGDMAQAVRDLHDLYTAAAAEPWSYEWLSVPGVAALAEGVDLQAGESALTDRSLSECRPLLALHCLLSESAVRIHLTQHALLDALSCLSKLQQLLTSFPSSLQSLVPSFHMLSGQYAAACGQHAHAGSHFSHVASEEAASPQMRRLAVLHACLAEANGQHPNWMGRAQALLATSPQQQEQPQPESLLEKGLRHLISGLMQLAEGDEAGGRVALSRALKLAHGELSDHQMVSQVLNTLAPIHLGRGDAQGATSMLTSSFTLAHNMKDLASQGHLSAV